MKLEQKNRVNMLPRAGRIIMIVTALGLLVTGYYAWLLFGYIFHDNVKQDFVLHVSRDATYEVVTDSLLKNDVLYNPKAFKWVSNKKEYPSLIKPGRYLLKKGMNTNELVNMLRAGQQSPVNVTFNNVRFPEQLAGIIARYLEADSTSLMAVLAPENAPKFGFTPETYRAMFIPNTYQFFWTATPEEFADRMKKEYDRFWNEQRRQKAEALGLTPVEVATLAAIVQEETIKEDEKPRVAGVYINRLRRSMPLQADPTVKFAVGDFTLQRILFAHLEIDSPYNTYKHAGLPPGPITFPEISSIDAVLNFEQHNYLYFCAKDDFSGYHAFARTHAEHNRNAERWRRALNERKIFR
ncbi:MAG: endolytic transglycosylase MltG [Bacteroidota bacterium]